MSLNDELTSEQRRFRPESPQRLSFEDLLAFGGPALVKGLADLVPIESARRGDTQVFAARSPDRVDRLNLTSLQALASVTSVVVSTDVTLQTELTQINELLVVGVFGSPLPDSETMVRLPGLDTLWVYWAPSGRFLEPAPQLVRTLRRLAVPRYLLPSDRPIEVLGSFHKLVELRLKDCARSDSLAPLAGLADLRRLSADAGRGWADLASCTEMEEVSAFRAQVKDLRPFRTWRKLRHLLVSMGSLRDLDGIGEFDRIEQLGLRGLEVNSLEPLRGLLSLGEIYLEDLPALSDLSPLGTLPNLRKVVIKGSAGARGAVSIQSLAPLATASCLEEIVLDHVSLQDQDLRPVIDLPNLRRIVIPPELLREAGVLRRERRDVDVVIGGASSRPTGFALGEVDVAVPVVSAPRWTIRQDLTASFGLDTNPEVQAMLWTALAGRSDGLLDRIQFDTEADATVVMADNETDIRAVAAAINDLADIRRGSDEE